MMRENERVVELADDACDGLQRVEKRRTENNVNIAIKGTISYEVVVGSVLDMDLFEREIGEKMLEKAQSLLILGIYIAVSSDKNYSTGILIEKFSKTNFKLRQVRDKLCIFSMRGEINTNMNSNLMIGKFKDDGCETGGFNLVDSDEGIEGFFP